MLKINDVTAQQISKAKSKHLIIDRLIVDALDEDFDSRAADSIESAFWEGHGECILKIEEDWHTFSNKYELDGMQFELPSKDFLSFNNPLGACKTCEGYGHVIGIDEDLVIPDKSLSVYEGCVQPWKGETMSEYKEQFLQQIAQSDFPIHRAYHDLNDKHKLLLWEGNKQVNGLKDFFKMLEEKYNL